MGRPKGSRNKRPTEAPIGRKRQRTIARIKPNSGLVFDPALRDSKFHLKASEMARLNRVLDAVATTGMRATSTVVNDEIEMTDVEYANFIDRENEKLDTEWWAIPHKDRPPLSEFLKRKGK